MRCAVCSRKNCSQGCAGGHPAFYQLDGQRLAIIRREPVRIGKCAGTRDMAALTNEQRARRASLLETLRVYRDRGAFPQNYDFPGQAVPYFVGDLSRHAREFLSSTAE